MNSNTPLKYPFISRLKSIFAPPSYTDEEDVWRTRLLLLAIWTLLPISTITGLIIASIATKPTGGLAGAGISLSLAAILILLMRWGQIKFARYVLGYGICIVFIVYFYFFGGLSGPYLSYIVVIMISGFILGWQAAVFTGIIGIICGFGLMIAELNNFLPASQLPRTPFNDWIVVSLIFTIAAIVMGMVTRDVGHSLKSARREVQERIQMQGELASLAAIVKQTTESVIITNPAGEIVYVNPKFEADTGYLASEVVGQNPRLLNSGIHTDEVFAELWDTIQAGKNWRGVITNRRKNGSLYNKESDIFPIRGPNDELIYFADVSRDVTDRLKNELALEQRVKELTVLHAVANASAEATSEDELIEQITQIIGETLYSDHFGVLLMVENGVGLQPHHSYHGVQEAAKSMVYPLDSGVAGYVARTGRPRRITDVTKEPLYLNVTPNMRSELCIPIKVGNRIIGLINAESAERNAFSEFDEQLMMTLADQLSTGIEKVRLFEESQRQTRELIAMNSLALETTSVLDMNLLLYRLFEEIQELIPAETFLVTLYDRTNDEIRIALAMEDNEPVEEMIDLVLPLSDGGLSGHVVKTQEPLLIDDLLHDTLPVQPKHGARPARSWLGVPLAARDSIIGAISLQSFVPNFFSDHQPRLVESLAAQVAIALDNARLFQAEQDRLRELQAMATISAALREAENCDDMLPMILEKVEQFSQADGTALWMLEPRHQTFLCELSSGVWHSWTGLRRESSAGFNAALKQGTPIQVDGNFPDGSSPQDLRFAELDAVLHIPLISEDQQLGLLCVGRSQSFNEGEIRVLSAIANISSNAIRRASLHDETEERLERLHALHRIDQAINASLDLGLTLRILVEQVISQLGVHAASVDLLIPQTQTLETAAHAGFTAESLISTPTRLGSSLAGQAALDRKTICVSNYEASKTDPDHAQLMAQRASGLISPRRFWRRGGSKGS